MKKILKKLFPSLFPEQQFGSPYVVIIRNTTDELKTAEVFGYYSDMDNYKDETFDKLFNGLEITSGIPHVTFMEMIFQVFHQPISDCKIEIITNKNQEQLPVFFRKSTGGGSSITRTLNFKNNEAWVDIVNEFSQFSFIMFPKTTVILKIHPSLKSVYKTLEDLGMSPVVFLDEKTV